MKRKRKYVMYAHLTPSVLCYPHEAQAIRDVGVVSVEMECHQMGRSNRNRLHRLMWEKIRQQHGHLRVGGYTCSEPRELDPAVS